MGNLEIWLINRQVIVEQDVNVYRTVFVCGELSSLATAGSMHLSFPQLPLYLLRGFQQLTRRERGSTSNNSVEKGVGRVEAPGFRLNKRRLAQYLSHPFMALASPKS